MKTKREKKKAENKNKVRSQRKCASPIETASRRNKYCNVFLWAEILSATFACTKMLFFLFGVGLCCTATNNIFATSMQLWIRVLVCLVESYLQRCFHGHSSISIPFICIFTIHHANELHKRTKTEKMEERKKGIRAETRTRQIEDTFCIVAAKDNDRWCCSWCGDDDDGDGDD